MAEQIGIVATRHDDLPGELVAMLLVVGREDVHEAFVRDNRMPVRNLHCAEWLHIGHRRRRCVGNRKVAVDTDGVDSKILADCEEPFAKGRLELRGILEVFNPEDLFPRVAVMR